MSAICLTVSMVTMVPLSERSSPAYDPSDARQDDATGGRIDLVAPESRTSFEFLSAGLILGLIGLLGIAPAERSPQDEDEDALVTEAWLCPGCLSPHIPGADFCPTCAAPLTPFAARGPFEEVFTRAWLLGRASQRPTRALHIVGLTFFGLPSLVGFILTATSLVGLRLEGAPFDLGGTGASLLYMLTSALYTALWVRGVARYRSGWTKRLMEVEGPVPYYGGPPWWTFDKQWALPDDRVA